MKVYNILISLVISILPLGIGGCGTEHKTTSNTSKTSENGKNNEVKLFHDALKKLYNADVYIPNYLDSEWYVPYYGPESRNANEVSGLVSLYEKLVKEYPKTTLKSARLGTSLTEFENNIPSHPLVISIWRDDIKKIIQRAGL